MKTDARVRFTRNAIRESLLGLLENKSIHKISVKEICEAAQINRATFYLHYKSPYDLLRRIEDELFESLSSEVIDKFDSDIGFITGKAFEIIGQHFDLCRILFSENGDRQFLDRAMSVSKERTIASWRAQYPGASKLQVEYLYAFVISGAVAVIERWVRSGMRETPLELGVVADKMCRFWLRGKK
jgi:AcrR family transcriptional regulator